VTLDEQVFDLAVLGGGPGGYVAAICAAQYGLSVVCVDENSKLGGTCLRVGCIPSKALLESSEKYAEAKTGLAEHGVMVGDVQFDLAAMHRRREAIVATLASGVASLLKQNGVTRIQGRGRLTAPGKLLVEATEGESTISAKRILIATGSVPASLTGIELDGDLIGSSSEALAYAEVPQHLVVIGAGYIGLEMGSVWSRLGAKVTVLEALDCVLPGMDTELAQAMRRILEKQGIEIRLGVRVERAVNEGGRCTLECAGSETIRCDRVLVAVGRVPNTRGIGLEAIGVEVDDAGEIPVSDTFQTTVEGIYAIGDCIRGPKLAHKASHEALACVEGMVGGHGRVNYDTIPGVVYTHPELATVGKTEEQLRERGHKYQKGVFPFQASGRARTLGQTEGRVKILADATTDRILGVHILGPRAGDLIAEAAAAMDFGASAEDLAHVCHAHPTLAESLGEAALGIADRAIHMVNRRK
jgi:dihydrolipoamide dehydrogenase